MKALLFITLITGITIASIPEKGSDVKVISRGKTNGELKNGCEFIYKIPHGFHYDSSMVKRTVSAFTLLENGKSIRNSAILLGEFTEHTDSVNSFDEYNRREIDFLKKHNVTPEITQLKPEEALHFEYQYVYEKWIAPPHLFKKLIRFKLPDGFYAISIHSQSEKGLEHPAFWELLKSCHFQCPDKK